MQSGSIEGWNEGEYRSTRGSIDVSVSEGGRGLSDIHAVPPSIQAGSGASWRWVTKSRRQDRGSRCTGFARRGFATPVESIVTVTDELGDLSLVLQQPRSAVIVGSL